MNTYTLNLEDKDGAISQSDFVGGVVLGSILSPNFKAVRTTAKGSNNMTDVKFEFSLPFSLNSLNLNTELTEYDSRFQGVKEFLDKPYVVAGRVVGILFNTVTLGGYDVSKDYDEYVKFNIASVNGGGVGERFILYIGIANGTLTESYAPFGINSAGIGAGIEAYKIYERNELINVLKGSISCNNSNWAGTNKGKNSATTLSGGPVRPSSSL